MYSQKKTVFNVFLIPGIFRDQRRTSVEISWVRFWVPRQMDPVSFEGAQEDPNLEKWQLQFDAACLQRMYLGVGVAYSIVRAPKGKGSP